MGVYLKYLARSLAPMVFTALTACAERAPQAERANESAPAATLAENSVISAPYPNDLARLLEMSAPYEDPDRPCLYRERSPLPGAEAIPKSRWREIQSDSYWLGDWARKNLGDRLAYAVVSGAVENGAVKPIYEIAVTGDAPIRPPALGDRAKDVPVRVVYDYPVSFAEFMARRENSNEAIAKLLPNLNGEGGSPGPHGSGFVRLDVYSPSGEPDRDVLAQCDALRRAYRLPVLIEFSSGRIQLWP